MARSKCLGRIYSVCDTVRLRALMLWLALRNRVSSRSAIGDSPVVVSLTTHGRRVRCVWYTIESIARGQIRPSRIIVWLDVSLANIPLSPELMRLRDRGVEFKFVEDIGPHQKYYYAIEEALSGRAALATIDDDTIYWSWWLKELVAAQSATPDAIVCYRARTFSFQEDGQPAPYADWPLFLGDEAAPTVFFTGVSGVLYPLGFLTELQSLGTTFKAVCPRADDIWLNFVATQTGTAARQVFKEPFGFPEVPDTQDIALWTNNAAGGNDAQIRTTYDPKTLAKIGSF